MGGQQGAEVLITLQHSSSGLSAFGILCLQEVLAATATNIALATDPYFPV